MSVDSLVTCLECDSIPKICKCTNHDNWQIECKNTKCSSYGIGYYVGSKDEVTKLWNRETKRVREIVLGDSV